MIPLIEEDEDLYANLKVYENCFFGCGNSTKYWHWKTNQPVCQSCAKNHKVSELPLSHPKYECKSMAEYRGAV